MYVPSAEGLTQSDHSGAQNAETPLKLVKYVVAVAVWFCRLIALLAARSRFSVTTVNIAVKG
jgi:hypothetical protein